MTRQTSIQAYNSIKELGLLSKRRFEVYSALYEHGPCTTNELYRKMTLRAVNNPAVHARLNELRAVGVVYEVTERICSVTRMTVIEWDVTDRLPIKLEKPKKIKCAHCDGRGYIIEQQIKLF